MKSKLNFKSPRGNPRVIVTIEIDEARMWLEGSESIREEMWNHLDNQLASWEKQMHIHESEEPIF